jgi:hypothetical protein
MPGNTYLLTDHCCLAANPHADHNTVLGMAVDSRGVAHHI